jgi:hypothetical protein
MVANDVSRNSCSQCKSWYASENELREHMRVVHRRFIAEPNARQNAGPRPETACK